MCSENAVTTRPFNWDENVHNAFTVFLLGENYSPEFRVKLQSPLQIIRATIAANNPLLTFSEEVEQKMEEFFAYVLIVIQWEDVFTLFNHSSINASSFQ